MLKSRTWWKLCQTRPDYFQLWEDGCGPGQTLNGKTKKPDGCGKHGKNGKNGKNGKRKRAEVTPGVLRQRAARCDTCEHHYSAHRCDLIDQGCSRTYERNLRSVGGTCPLKRWVDHDPLATHGIITSKASKASKASQCNGRAIWKSEPVVFPPVQRLAILTSYYNTCAFKQPLANYRRFAEAIRILGGELWTVELVFDDQEYSIPDAQLHVRGSRERNLLWQKERLLNLLLRILPSDVDGVAWLDADVMFDTPDWIEQAKDALSRYPLIQPWEQVAFLDQRGGVSWAPRSCAWYWHHDRVMCNLPGVAHPGFAWAIRADIIRRHGFYDAMPTGGGDTMMVPGFLDVRVESIDFLNDGWREHAARWAHAMYADIQGSLGYLPGQIRHLFHGSLANKQYAKRWRESRQGKFDPHTDIVDDDNGLWAWSEYALETKAPMIRWIHRYFEERQEDG